MRMLPVLLVLMSVAPALAQEADVPMPRPRPEAVDKILDPAVPAEPANPAAAPATEAPDDAAMPGPPLAPLPRPRPGPKIEAPETPEADGEPANPPPEPRVYQTACPAVLAGQVDAEPVPPISEGQCGLQSPLTVAGLLVNGRMVPLTSPATLSCGMATALPAWVSAVDSYVRARENTEIARVIAGTSYMCRNVNGAATGNLSDHAFADALDVVGFELADGRRVTVEAGWSGGAEAGEDVVRYAHDAACNRFTTVLGPEANALHRDHLHVDLLCHGRTCTARLCE